MIIFFSCCLCTSQSECNSLVAQPRSQMSRSRRELSNCMAATFYMQKCSHTQQLSSMIVASGSQPTLNNVHLYIWDIMNFFVWHYTGPNRRGTANLVQVWTSSVLRPGCVELNALVLLKMHLHVAALMKILTSPSHFDIISLRRPSHSTENWLWRAWASWINNTSFTSWTMVCWWHLLSAPSSASTKLPMCRVALVLKEMRGADLCSYTWNQLLHTFYLSVHPTLTQQQAVAGDASALAFTKQAKKKDCYTYLCSLCRALMAALYSVSPKFSISLY